MSTSTRFTILKFQDSKSHVEEKKNCKSPVGQQDICVHVFLVSLDFNWAEFLKVF